MMRISISKLQLAYSCWRKYWYQYVTKEKPEPQMALVLGGAIHSFVANSIHSKKTPPTRDHFFTSAESAVKAWRNYWWREWNNPKNNFHPLTSAQAAKACRDGERNIFNYMTFSLGRCRPQHLELRQEMFLDGFGVPVTLLGIVDQVRPLDSEWAIKNGKNPNGVALIDLKSGKPKYWWDHEKATMTDQVRSQTPLRNNIQATAYYMLWNHHFGVYPEMFSFLFLGGDKISVVSTNRDEVDITEFRNCITHFLDVTRGTNIEHFPKTTNDYTCNWCGFWKVCSGNKVTISIPGQGENIQERSETVEIKPPPVEKQMRIKFKKERKKKE